MIRILAASLSLAFLLAISPSAQADEAGWIEMFDGKSFDGWKVNESKESFSIIEGAIRAKGDRSHCFYVGDGKPFKNFEFEAEVMTLPNSNGGIYFHTQFQDTGWPKHGIEVQVNNTYAKDPIKTGSLYQLKNITTAPAKDNEFFKVSIKVEGKKVLVKVNDLVVDYTEPEGKEPGKDFTRVITEGTFCLQAHDPGSTVFFRKLRVRRLP